MSQTEVRTSTLLLQTTAGAGKRPELAQKLGGGSILGRAELDWVSGGLRGFTFGCLSILCVLLCVWSTFCESLGPPHDRVGGLDALGACGGVEMVKIHWKYVCFAISASPRPRFLSIRAKSGSTKIGVRRKLDRRFTSLFSSDRRFTSVF